jgi:pyrroline-5-carboxylate reductase
MRITIIGCGNMGSALASQLFKNHPLALFDRHPEKSAALEEQGHGTAVSTLKQALSHAEILILAIKPQHLDELAKDLKPYLKGNPLIISLLAGTPFAILKKAFPKKTLVRMMPNLAVSLGKGVVGLAQEGNLSEDKQARLSTLFKPMGKILWLPEKKLDPLTAMAGSGPAFVFVMVEAMVDAAIAMGFSTRESQEIVLQMMKGSLALLEETEKHPAELKWQVASPAGTTIAGLRKLEECALRSAIIETFLAAYQRALEINS